MMRRRFPSSENYFAPRALLPFPEQGEDDRPVIESLNLNKSNRVPALGISAELVAKLDEVIAKLTDLCLRAILCPI